MRIDCEGCAGHGFACGGCVVALVLGGAPPDVATDDVADAARVLVAAGLVDHGQALPAVLHDRSSARPAPEGRWERPGRRPTMLRTSLHGASPEERRAG